MIDLLLREAKRLIAENPSATQVNLIAAANRKSYFFLRCDLESEEQEDRCLQQLAVDKASLRFR